MILITGGARSGKSLFGENLLINEMREKLLINETRENLLTNQKKVLYIATALAFDDEMKERIKKHKAQRSDNWDTLEDYRTLGDKLICLNKKYDGIILDCITVMVTNLLMQATPNFTDEEYLKLDYRVEETKILYEMKNLTSAFNELEIKNNTKIVVITNEIGSGIVPENKLGREFRDIAGRVNQYLAKEANEVYVVISGIPVKIKG